eukprot:6181987-Pleurochrysis_carterae.AAC.2
MIALNLRAAPAPPSPLPLRTLRLRPAPHPPARAYTHALTHAHARTHSLARAPCPILLASKGPSAPLAASRTTHRKASALPVLPRQALWHLRPHPLLPRTAPGPLAAATPFQAHAKVAENLPRRFALIRHLNSCSTLCKPAPLTDSPC